LAWNLPFGSQIHGKDRSLTVQNDQLPLPTVGASLVDAATFRLLLELEIRKAQRLRYCLSLVRLRGRIPGGDGAAASLAHILAPRIRATDVALACGPDEVALLLVDADISSLPTILRRVIADFEGMAWHAGVASFPKNGSGPDHLLDQAERMLMEAERNSERGASPQS
jgi:hypothetical protein